MDKFDKIYEDTIPSNYILDRNSVLECMKKSYDLGVSEERKRLKDIKSSYDLGVSEERKRLKDIKSSYDAIIDEIIDDPRCDTVKSISIENKKKNYGLL
jgi:hypothetical protein